MKRIVYLITAFLLILSGCDMDVLVQNPSLPIDEWEISTPEEQGFDTEALSRAFAKADQLQFVNSIVIVRNGYLVAEVYYNGWEADKAHNFKGVSTSVMSALVGIALRENFLDSLDQKMLDFFPEYITPKLDRRKNDITIQHLLEMKAGFDKERNNYWQVYNSDNWIKSTIDLPLLSNPEEKFRYNTFQAHLVSGIITKASGMNNLDFANKYLMSPLKISIKCWERDPQGVYFGGNHMYFTPRDMARIGLLFLNNGTLEDEEIIPAEWVATSRRNYIEFDNQTWGELHDYSYGYLWWTGKIKDYEVTLEIGFAGQFVINIPGLNMVIVTTANHGVDWDRADWQEREVINVVANYILAAIVD